MTVKGHINRDMGIVDILVNNAGLMPKASLREGQPNDMQRVLDVNVSAHFWVLFTLALCYLHIQLSFFFFNSTRWSRIFTFILTICACTRGNITILLSTSRLYWNKMCNAGPVFVIVFCCMLTTHSVDYTNFYRRYDCS